MRKRITPLLLALCLILLAASVYADAATGQQVTANAVTVTAGNTASVTLKAENFENIAALDVYVYYDADIFSVSNTSNGSMLSGAQTSVNTTETGKITLSMMSLNGISGTGNLLTVRFTTKSDCDAGTYPITVAIGRAYDSALAEATIGGVNGSVTVNKPVETEYFYLSGSRSASTVQKGETLSCQVNNSGSRSFVSGEFTFTYDYELFSFDSVTLGSGLTKEGAVYSVNSSVLGQVRIAYACDTAVSAYHLFTVKLTVIGDVDTTTTVKATAANMYRADLSMYLPGSWSQSVTLKQVLVNDYPNVFLRTEQMIIGQQSTSVFCLEAGAGVAAADFTLTYDPTVLRCTNVKACDGVGDLGGMLVINDSCSNGTIRFSYVNMDAYDASELPLVEITWEPLRSPDIHYQIAISGVGVVDADQNPIPMEYVTDSDCIFARTVIAPTCLQDGFTDHTCACGENYQTDPTLKLGHDIHQVAAQTVSCTNIGWDAYEICSRCDYTTYVEIPALGHDEIYHDAKSQTCLDIGWEPYLTCTRCDYSTYQELPALGHRVVISNQVSVDPLMVQNDSVAPFLLTEGVYYSTNHQDSSSSEFMITALYDCKITLTYGVSSERNYDKLYLHKNGSQLAMISGTVTNQKQIVSLSAGDVLTVRYSKDGSASSGDDCGWFKLEYDHALVGEDIEVPADSLEPNCTNAVICSYCGAVVKSEMGHVYGAGFVWNDAHTGAEATLICARGCGAQAIVDCDVSEDLSDPAKTVHTATASFDGMVFTDSKICNNYLVHFLDWDGRQISSNYYHSGKTVTLPSDPDREADNTYTYTFVGWDKEVVSCAGDATYTATYTSTYIDYTVVFKDWNGTVLSTKTYHWGDAVTAPADPAKAADNTYIYTFTGWDKEVVNCAGDTTYTATYTSTYIDYTVVFKDWNGTVLSAKTYHWGDQVAVPEAPAKASDNTYTYTFAGWDKEVVNCTGDATYTATYTPSYIDYIVVFKNWDGTELSTKTYHWGDKVTAPADPSKGADNTYTYAFAGWDKEVVNCTGDATYTATYTPSYIDYTVVFKNWDGTELSTKTYHWGDAVTAPADPAKAADNTYIYTFAGWDKEVVNCAGDTTYTATYTSTYIDYTVVFKDWNGTVLSAKTYHWGDQVAVPNDPAKASDNTYTYTFAGWDKEVVNCAGDATYTATYTPVYIDYTVEFKDWNGTVLSTKTYHWGDAVTAPADPAKAADNTYIYTFAGWDKEVVNCVGNTTYTATYTPTYIDYTVVFKDWNGDVLSTKTYHWGEAVTVPADPAKAADNTYTYTFAGWDKEVINCAGDATYTATYTPTFIEYTVTFLNADGTVISSKIYHYGESVAEPSAPVRPESVDKTYVFGGWDKTIVDCHGDIVYTAVFVSPLLPGDMNEDDQVDDADALYLLRHTLFPNRYPVNQDADVNSDGELSDADALYLLRYTLFPNRYPLYPLSSTAISMLPPVKKEH